jgi:hypothetical protein
VRPGWRAIAHGPAPRRMAAAPDLPYRSFFACSQLQAIQRKFSS